MQPAIKTNITNFGSDQKKKKKLQQKLILTYLKQCFCERFIQGIVMFAIFGGRILNAIRNQRKGQ